MNGVGQPRKSTVCLRPERRVGSSFLFRSSDACVLEAWNVDSAVVQRKRQVFQQSAASFESGSSVGEEGGFALAGGAAGIAVYGGACIASGGGSAGAVAA